jgi:ABC-type multidrug transport system fused ATPase/permease subunit
MVACHLGRLALGWKVAARMSRLTLEVVRELTDALHRKLHRLEMCYFDTEPTGHIMARLTCDVGSLLIFLSGGSLQLVSDLLVAAGISGFLF